MSFIIVWEAFVKSLAEIEQIAMDSQNSDGQVHKSISSVGRILACALSLLELGEYEVATEIDLKTMREANEKLSDRILRDGYIPAVADLARLRLVVPAAPRFASAEDYEATGAGAREVQFVNMGGYMDELKNKLFTFSREWRESGSYLAPYVAVVNASMMGKSRMVMQLKSLEVFVLPFCLRSDPEPHLFPRQTEALYGWASAPPISEAVFTNQMCAVFHAYLELLRDWLPEPSGAPSLLKDLTTQWAAAVGDVGREFQATLGTRLAGAESKFPLDVTEQSTSEDVAVAWRSSLASVRAEISRKVAQIFPAETSCMILFFIDEARSFYRDETVDSFVLARNAMRALPFHEDVTETERMLDVFVVVADTTSKISNIAPSGINLFPPFSLLKTIDLWLRDISSKTLKASKTDVAAILAEIQAKVICRLDGTRNSPPTVDPGAAAVGKNLSMNLLKQFGFAALVGRPFYFAFYVSRIEKGVALAMQAQFAAEVARTSLIEYLQKKLLNTTEMPKPGVAMKLTDAQAVAVLGTLASVDVGARSELASELAAKHLRIVAAISMDRESVLTVNTAEPALAMAAWELIRSNRVTWPLLIENFCSEAVRSSTETGFRGELAAQILLLVAFHYCLPATAGRSCAEAFPGIPVCDFMDSLISTRLLNMRVSREQGSSPELLDIILRIETDHGIGCESVMDLVEFLGSLEASEADQLIATFGTLPHDEVRFLLTTTDAKRQQIVGEASAELISKYKADRKYAVMLSRIGASEIEKIRELCAQAENPEMAREKLVSAVENLRWLRAWSSMREDVGFQGGQVRVYQVVKRHGRGLSKKVLFDLFIRGAIIHCVERQELVDIVVPIAFPGVNGEISEEGMGGIVIQVRLRQKLQSEPVKSQWAKEVAANFDFPFIAVFAEFGDVDDPKSTDSAEQFESVHESRNKRKLGCESGDVLRGYVLYIQNWQAEDLGSAQSIGAPLRRLLRSITQLNDKLRPRYNHGIDDIQEMFKDVLTFKD